MKIEPLIYYTDENGEEFAKPNPEFERIASEQLYDIRLHKSGIPKNYYDLDFDMYQGNQSIKSKDNALKFAKNCRNEDYHNVSLYLVGVNSSQKTMIACAIGKEFLKQNLKVRFILAGHLIDLLMKSQGFSYIEEIENQIKQLLDTDLLIIDDIFDPNKSLFWKNSSELVITAWDSFLRHLISNDIRMVLTSNHSIESIETKFGKDIFHLIKRNFKELTFYDSIKEVRRERFEGLFD